MCLFYIYYWLDILKLNKFNEFQFSLAKGNKWNQAFKVFKVNEINEFCHNTTRTKLGYFDDQLEANFIKPKIIFPSVKNKSDQQIKQLLIQLHVKNIK